MNSDKNPPAKAALQKIPSCEEVSFIECSVQSGLMRPNQWNLGRRIIVLLAIGWLPLFLITAITNPNGLLSLLDGLSCSFPDAHCYSGVINWGSPYG